MPNQLTVIYDTRLLSDPDAIDASLSDDLVVLDGAGAIPVLTIVPVDGENELFETLFSFDSDGEIIASSPILTAPTGFGVETLSNGNLVSIDGVFSSSVRNRIEITISAPDGTEIDSQIIGQTEVSFPDDDVIALASGGFVATWLDSDSSSSRGETALQFFDNDGNAITERLTPGTMDGSSNTLEDEPLIFETPSGGVGVFWLQDDEETIKYASYDADGTEIVPEIDLGLTYDRRAPEVSYFSDGSFLVISDLNQAAVFASDGTPFSPTAAPVDVGAGDIIASGRLEDGYALAYSETAFDAAGIASGYENVVRLFDENNIEVGNPVSFGLTSDRIRDAQILTLDGTTFALAAEQSGSFLGVQDDPVLVTIFSASEGDETLSRAPVVTSRTEIAFDENSTAPVIVTARDLDGDTVSFTIAPSDDAALFEIDAATGALNFREAQDFEAPSDFDGDGVYDVAVEASAGTDSLIVDHQITLNDLAEQISGGPNPADYENIIVFDERDDSLFPTFRADDVSVQLATNDLIDLGAGNDNVRAGAGDDYIIAGPGIDAGIWGGLGRDIFQFGLGDEFVRIRDFDQGSDLIFLAEGLSLDALSVKTFTHSDGTIAVRLTTEQGDRLVIDNLATGLTQADLFTADSALPSNAAPTISLSGSSSFFENSSRALGASIRDNNEDATNLPVALSGPDAALFDVSVSDTPSFGSASVSISFIDPPDFERPSDADGDNIYEYTVSVTDSEGLTTSRDVAFTVSDVDEQIAVIEGFDAIMRGDDEDNRLSGTDGDDLIIGDGGADLIRAGAGNDLIDAGSGLDYRIYGGDGEDLFVFDLDSDRMRVMDFTFGEDRIVLGEGIFFEDLQIEEWRVFEQLEDGTVDRRAGITVSVDGEDDRLSIALADDVQLSDVRLTADDFVLFRDLTLPESDAFF